MNKREFFVVFLILFFVTAIFFYKTFLHGLVSFPGDLLIAEYKPWRTYSYLGYNPGSYPHKAQYFDTLRQIYPWKTFSLKELEAGQFRRRSSCRQQSVIHILSVEYALCSFLATGCVGHTCHPPASSCFHR